VISLDSLKTVNPCSLDGPLLNPISSFAVTVHQQDVIYGICIWRIFNLRLYLQMFCHFQSVAEAYTEEQFHEKLQVLYNSDVWSENPRLQKYIEKQWLDDNMHKVSYSSNSSRNNSNNNYNQVGCWFTSW